MRGGNGAPKATARPDVRYLFDQGRRQSLPQQYKGDFAMAVRTTVVGSWWPYPELERNLAGYHAGKLSFLAGG